GRVARREDLGEPARVYEDALAAVAGCQTEEARAAIGKTHEGDSRPVRRRRRLPGDRVEYASTGAVGVRQLDARGRSGEAVRGTDHGRGLVLALEDEGRTVGPPGRPAQRLGAVGAQQRGFG